MAAAVVYTSTDAKFFVYEATIVGARHIDAHTVYNVAGIHEQNIFWIQPRQVAERVFQIDGVRAVRVRCALPARVIIEITEREPVVLWRSDAHQQDWWVDEEGTILPYHGDTDDPAVLFVLDTSEPSFQSGEQLRPEGVVRSVQQLAKAMQGTRLFYFGSDRGLSFTQQTQGGQWPVYVGDSLNLAHKIQVLEALTRYMESHGIWPSYVDVRWADRPVYGVPTNIGE